MIVRELQKLQGEFGYLSRENLQLLAKGLGTPLYRLQEVASFFPHFRFTPPAAIEVQVCRDMACHLNGAPAVLKELQGLAQGFEPRQLQIQTTSCLGRCDRAPACAINGHNYLGRSPQNVCQVVRQFVAGDPPPADTDRALEIPDAASWKIDVYQGKPEYAAVRRYLANPDKAAERQRVIKALETGGLLGMGGAGGRAYKKWEDVYQANGTQKYVVCNGDESEPGTFKDRELLLRMPHLVIEGMILGGLVVGATKGYVYIRHEYEEQIEAVEHAIHAAERQGLCGPNLLGTGLAFQLEVFTSPGGYICGEQSAMIEVLQDKRAEPRNRPPQLQTNGLFDKPTLVNNVETLAWVPSIVLNEDGQWYAAEGRSPSKGRRFFSLSGDVRRPGVFEVPCGITLRELIAQAGGMRDDLPLKAFAPSGPSGGFLPARLPVSALPPRFVQEKLPPGATDFDILDLELDIQIARNMRIMVGAGMVVYAEGANLVEQAVVCSEFFRNETCGKCVPCRIGSHKVAEFGNALRQGDYDSGRLQATQAVLRELAQAMQLTSICGLGTVASNPLTSLLTHFREDVDHYLKPA